LIQKEDGNDRQYHHVSFEARSFLGRDDQSISRDSAQIPKYGWAASEKLLDE
jgi:hypothetical protein